MNTTTIEDHLIQPTIPPRAISIVNRAGWVHLAYGARGLADCPHGQEIL